MSQEPLFSGAEPTPSRPSASPYGRPRFQVAIRNQQGWVAADLDGLLGGDHRARVVWDFVAGLDLRAFYDRIGSVEGGAGRPPIDPAILMALWLYATAEGVGSARALARLCDEHDAYRWICGGVSVNHHTLSDFRTEHGADLDRLLTQSVAALMAEGLVSLERVAQDGVRVRASAGAGSFRGEDALAQCLKDAEEQVATLKRELEEDPSATTIRQAAAKTRAAKEREERVRRAIAQRDEAEKRKKGEEEKKKARASTTDPQARVMKMGDGGFRPAFNAQLATDTASQIVVGVGAGNEGTDGGQLAPMVEQIEGRYGRRPRQVLVDGGYVKLDDIEEVTAAGTEIYAPVPRPREPTRARYAPKPGDGPCAVAWRARMATPRAQEIYKERAATAECVNALARNRGLRHLVVRGIEKVRAVLLWFALAHNMMRAASLREGQAIAA